MAGTVSRCLRRLALAVPLGLALAGGVAGLAPAVPASAQQAAPDTLPDTLLVLDMSNSMWGQIDGRAKVEIAREALGELASSLADGTPVGLMAYGHRRKGDCGDVEMVLPVTPIDRQALARVVAEMKPRGKTPITEALREAATALNANDRPARLVLISDGIETCGGDPCALARELAASGIDFTAHVIGFDIASRVDQAKIACIASATGGQYFNAGNAGELAEALAASTRAVTETPARFAASLSAVEAETGAAVEGPVEWTVLSAEDESVVASVSGNAARVELAPGRYVVTASAGERAGGGELTVSEQGGEAVVKLASDLPDASVTPAAASAPASSTLSVAFTGPGDDSDFLRIVPADGSRLETDLWAWTRDGSPLAMRLPSEPGAYEIVYVYARNGERVLARAPITVTPAELALELAAEVPAGTMTQVSWRGPNGEGDYLAMVPPGGGPADIAGRYAWVRDGERLSMQAPAEPGDYEAVYIAGNDGSVMIRKAFRVVPAPATLDFAGKTEAGAMIEVRWTGPASPGDWIGLAPAGAPAAEYLGWTGPDSPTVTLQLPAAPGAYELRYVLSAPEGAKVLAMLPITVTAPVVRLAAPAEVAAGSEFTVEVEGPAAPSNWVGFALPGDGDAAYIGGAWTGADNIRDGKVQLIAPTEPGAYELRFVISSGDARVAARQNVTVR